ncbi:RCC1 domain-containing protein [Streptomyces sp. NPDC059688]|uniref:RCC1 domain-containing protein n=1 Tax=Streptomyces sp. NPDC059688 TaxID=3346906 RepID=UPI0036CD0D4E
MLSAVDHALRVIICACRGGRGFACRGRRPVRERRVWSWGNNRAGQLGDGTWADVCTAPTAVVGLRSTEVVGIAAGGFGTAFGHGLALLTDGTVRSWGANGAGQLGDSTVLSHNDPGPVVHLAGVVSIAAGGAHSLALLTDHSVVAWGRNDCGQLGNGANADSSVPVGVEGLDSVVAIAAGLHHSLALREDGTVWAWGHNHNGQLGDGTCAARNVPALVKGLTGVTQITAGASHNLALVGPPGNGGVIMAWGHNASGQLGDDSTTNRSTPVKTRDSWSGGVARIAAGANHSAAITSTDNALHTWGRNTSGQLGSATTKNQATPIPVPGLTGIQLAACGREHTLALLTDNTVRSWGNNCSGQLGNRTTTGSSTPMTILSELSGVDELAAPVGGDFSLAR